MPELRVVVSDHNEVLVTRDGDDDPVSGAAADDTRLWQTLQVLQGLLDDKRLTQREEFELLGSCLFDLLFTGEVRETVKRWLGDIFDAPGAGESPFLRIVLQFSQKAGEIAELPWEFLHIPSDINRQRAGFVAARQELAFSRRIKLDGQRLPIPAPTSERLRIFVGIASPEKEEKGEALVSLAPIRDEATVVDVLERFDAEVTTEPELTRDGLRAALRSGPGNLRPHVVHLVAHGVYDGEAQRGSLALCTEDRTALARWVSDSDISDCFAHVPRIVFLHACNGARSNQIRGLRGIALKLVERGVPAVVAMNFEIPAAMANKFATRVYEELAKGTPIDQAVQLGRADLGTDPRPRGNFSGREFGCPVAFVQMPGAVILPMRVTPVDTGPVAIPNGALNGTDDAVAVLAPLRCPCGNTMLPGMKRCIRCTRFVEQCAQPDCQKLRYTDTDLCPWCGHSSAPVGTRAEAADASGSMRAATIPSTRERPSALDLQRRERMS